MSCDVSLDFLFCFLLFAFFLSKNCTLKTGMTGLRCRVLTVHFAKSFHRKTKSQGLNHRMKKHKAYGNLHCIVVLYSIKIKALLKITFLNHTELQLFFRNLTEASQ